MTITITINCDNAAFDGANCGREIRRILREQVKEPYDGQRLLDSNGNTVGKVEVSE